jgi:predicted transcriptional regulator
MSELSDTIRRELVVQDEEIFVQILPELKKLIRLDSKGKAVFVVDRSRFNQSDQVLLLLMARWFAHRGEMQTTDGMTLDELEAQLGIDRKTLRARIAELSERRVIEKLPPGAYRIEYPLIPETTKTLVRKVMKVG